MKKSSFLVLEQCRREQLLSVGISELAGYDPFDITRKVAFRAKVVPPELLIIPGHSFGIAAICLHSAVICDESFLKDVSEREFEGIVGHELGHLINLEEVLLRAAWCSFLGFFQCGAFFFWGAAFFFFFRIVSDGNLFGVEFAFTVMLFALTFATLSFLCFCIYRFLQKKREFAADKKALSLTRYPVDFVNRLLQIMFEEEYSHPERNSIGLFQTKKNNTHPPARKRVKAAKKILKKRGMR